MELSDIKKAAQKRFGEFVIEDGGKRVLTIRNSMTLEPAARKKFVELVERPMKSKSGAALQYETATVLREQMTFLATDKAEATKFFADLDDMQVYSLWAEYQKDVDDEGEG